MRVNCDSYCSKSGTNFQVIYGAHMLYMLHFQNVRFGGIFNSLVYSNKMYHGLIKLYNLRCATLLGGMSVHDEKIGLGTFFEAS